MWFTRVNRSTGVQCSPSGDHGFSADNRPGEGDLTTGRHFRQMKVICQLHSSHNFYLSVVTLFLLHDKEYFKIALT